MADLLERLLELEAEVEYKNPPPPGQADYRYSPGSIPVILSAPHGAAHTRRGKIKDEDEYTTGLARLLAELTGAHAIYAWRKSAFDPNYDRNAPYKQALKEIVRRQRITFILDLHGCSPERSFGIALGSMRGKSCPTQLPIVLDILASNGYTPAGRGLFRLDLDRTFPGGGKDHRETITRFAAETLGVAALQVELNAHLRVPYRLPIAAGGKPFNGNPDLIRRAINTLQAVIQAVARMEMPIARSEITVKNLGD